MYITSQSVITCAAVLAAIAAIVGYYNKAYKFVRHQAEQDKRMDEQDARMKETEKCLSDKISALENLHSKDINGIGEELTLLCYAMTACLDGLSQLGANHGVTEAMDKLQKHINKKAHGQTTS